MMLSFAGEKYNDATHRRKYRGQCVQCATTYGEIKIQSKYLLKINYHLLGYKNVRIKIQQIWDG